jgi:5'(3')-deoxyribonucleotidase
MKKILIDLDDVLSVDGFLNMMNSFLNTNYTYNDINDYYVETLIPDEKMIEYRKFFNEHNVYNYSIPAPHSKEVLMNLMLEYEVYICSSYYSDFEKGILPNLIPKKCEFLMKNYPFLTASNFMFINDKSMIDVDIRIDDKIENLTGAGIKLLYTAYHNKDISNQELIEKNIIRVNDWLDIKDKLLIVKKK